MVFNLGFRILKQLALGFRASFASAGTTFAKSQHRVSFRTKLVDLDFFGHMNNASYIRIGELSRWHLLMASSLGRTLLEKRWLFLVVGQTAVYRRQIAPFQKFDVVTTSTVSADGKWFNFEHVFVHPGGEVPTESPLAVVDVRVVLKRKSGKTVRAHELAAVNAWAEEHVLAQVSPKGDGAARDR